MASIFSPNLFHGQVVLITGGGTGIGLATAELFAELGAAVAICSRSSDHIEPAAHALRRFGTPVHARTCDIRDADAVNAFVDGVREALGGINVLVNNAGGQFPAPAVAMTPRGFEAVVRNNLNGTFYMTHAVATRVMIPKGEGGRIINITAVIDRGFPGMAHTGAARAGVENLAKSLAIEWAEHRILVNCIAPGIIASAPYPREILEEGRKRTPLKRVGQPAEIALGIAFLASPAAAFVTGTVLHMDGGARLWGDLWPIPELRDHKPKGQ